MYLGQDHPLGDDTEDEGVLAVGEAVGPVWRLPVRVLLHQVHMVERVVVELGVRYQSWARRIISCICRAQCDVRLCAG